VVKEIAGSDATTVSDRICRELTIVLVPVWLQLHWVILDTYSKKSIM
jgi:hypothetical protein